MLTRLQSCVSIMKLWTCFSALVSSSFLATTATTSAVQPAPCRKMHRLNRYSIHYFFPMNVYCILKEDYLGLL